MTDEEARARFHRTVSIWFHRFDPEVGRDIADRTIYSSELLNWMTEHELDKYDVRPRLHEITAPTLILAGRWDWRTTVEHAEIMQRWIPEAELVVFEGSGHMLYIEEQDKFLAAVRDFMERYPRRPTGR